MNRTFGKCWGRGLDSDLLSLGANKNHPTFCRTREMSGEDIIHNNNKYNE